MCFRFGFPVHTEEGYDISVDFGHFKGGAVASVPCPPTFRDTFVECALVMGLGQKLYRNIAKR